MGVPSELGFQMRTSEAASHIGVSEDRLDRWCRRGYLAPSAGGKGKGDNRWWSPRDILVAALCRDLLEDGVDTGRIGEATRLASESPEWAEQVLVIGERVTIYPLEQIGEAMYWERGVLRMVNLGNRERTGGVVIVPLTEARARLLELVRDAETEDIVIGRHGRPVAVLTTPEHLESLRDQIEELEDQLSVFQSRESDPGMRLSHEKVKAELGLL